MQLLYTFVTYLIIAGLRIAQYFNSKLRLFVQGRKNTWYIIENSIDPERKVIWFHCASLGEYEQALPIMKEIKKRHSEDQLLISFFSPSGYEIKKEAGIADAVVYLPMDTPNNVRKWLDLVNPKFSFFIKYEIWPNYLNEMRRRQYTAFLISATFREDQFLFTRLGTFLKRSLESFEHIFVQDQHSEEVLKRFNMNHVSVSGDTRFDRVSHQIEQDNHLQIMDIFKGDQLCMVCGSTWPEDEEILIPMINKADEKIKFVIAPHEMNKTQIERLQSQLNRNSVCYSTLDESALRTSSVFIIDTIGLLTRIYSYADIAYVGGAMGNTGLHNILEPATFGIPIIIGKNYEKFPEAKKLRSLAGLYSVSDTNELHQLVTQLITDDNFREKTGMIAGHFVDSNTGATNIILNYLEKYHSEIKSA
ncbi:MAG: 3-deoxy-D-manno-octulosonic acid transferase [Flavobacteriaceae bacterium]|nr:3-deoxy-D-manno-octulosonic acid transferase [Flavobacteriaceae bacterium]